MVVVVLGQRLESGSIHPELRRRVDVGIEAFRETDAPYLIFTGGRTNPDVPVAECDVMRDYAIERGVPPERLLVDDEARDTKGNAYFVRRIVQYLDADFDRVYVVTSQHHVPRAVYVFEQCFGDEYEIDATYFVEADARDASIRNQQERQLRRDREFFDPIPVGDVEAIRRRLAEAHDHYDYLHDEGDGA